MRGCPRHKPERYLNSPTRGCARSPCVTGPVGWRQPSTKGPGQASARHWTRPSSRGSWLWRADRRRRDKHAGPCACWRPKPNDERSCPALAGKPFASLSKTTTSSRGGKKMWCVAEVDEAYWERMDDVLEIYERPYNPQEPVVCLDEKPVVLHRDLRPASAAEPAQPAKRDYEYERCGTANVFCAVEPLAGRHFTWPTPNRSGKQFALILRRLANAYPNARTIHLVLDTSARIPVVRCCASSAIKAIPFGTASRFTSPPNTPVGSIRPRSRSASSPGNAWARDEFPRCTTSALSAPPGIAA